MSLEQQNSFTGVVHLGSDHAGFECKEYIKHGLTSRGFHVEDHGALSFDPHDDYSSVVKPAAAAIQNDPSARAIVFGKSGQGEAIVANRMRGVRAAVYTGGNLELVSLAREHNDANVLSIGAGFVPKEEAFEAVLRFLITPFSNDERHVRRIKELDE